MPLIKEQSKTEQSEIPQSTLNAPAPNQKGLVSIVGSLLPLAPIFFEQWTGQKIPPMTGTLAEMNNSLSQLSLALTQILNNQQQLWTKLEALEKSAGQHFTTLGQQFQSLRLTHTREKKEIEYNPKPETEY